MVGIFCFHIRCNLLVFSFHERNSSKPLDRRASNLFPRTPEYFANRNFHIHFCRSIQLSPDSQQDCVRVTPGIGGIAEDLAGIVDADSTRDGEAGARGNQRMINRVKIKTKWRVDGSDVREMWLMGRS